MAKSVKPFCDDLTKIEKYKISLSKIFNIEENLLQEVEENK